MDSAMPSPNSAKTCPNSPAVFGLEIDGRFSTQLAAQNTPQQHRIDAPAKANFASDFNDRHAGVEPLLQRRIRVDIYQRGPQTMRVQSLLGLFT